MAILPTSLARVSNLMSSNVTLSSINKTQGQLLQVQNQISTGKSVNAPSDNPTAAAVIQQLQKTLSQRDAYSTNLNFAASQLGEVDSTLGDLSGLIQQAQTTASANVGSDATPDQRKAAAELVKSIQSEIFSIGNKQFNGAYLFGGTKSNQPPFVDRNGIVQFVGSTHIAQNAADDNAALPYMVDGASVFGALKTLVAGTANLAPTLAANTRLTDLGGAAGNGVQLGSIRLGNGASTVDLDLSHADTVGDVVTLINGAGLAGVGALVSGGGIQLSGAGNLSVNEIGGGTTAVDLGLLTPAGAGAGLPINGQPLLPLVTPLTRLSDLRGGAGLDLSGLKIVNGATTTALNFAGDNTVEDLLNTVNGSKAGVLARINAAGTGIDIVNKTQGSSLAIAENGGTTAAQLGLQSTIPSTPLSSLNGGQGIRSANPPAPDFKITRADGSTFSVSVGNLQTVQDVINAINTADAGGGVAASFGANSNGIMLTDSTGGAGAVSVVPVNGSAAATDLGLLSPAVGNTITGRDVNPVNATGVFADLAKLTSALLNNDTGGITAAAALLKSDYSQVVLVRGVTGAKEQEVTARQSQLGEENLATQTLLSTLQDTDLPTAISRFQTLQTALQANYAMSAKMLNMSLLNFLG